MGDRLVDLAWLGCCLVLVVSALVARRLSGGAWVRLAALWVAIIGVAWALMSIAQRLLVAARFT